MIQPSGLAGLRQASTRPTAANAADTHTGIEPPPAFRFWCASPDSGTAAANKASNAPPMTRQAARDVSRMLPTTPTVRGERSGNVTVLTVSGSVTHTWPRPWHAYADGREDQPASLPRPGRGGRGGRGRVRGRQDLRPPRGGRASGRADRVSPHVEAPGAGELAARRR